jgi:NAD+ kinase
MLQSVAVIYNHRIGEAVALSRRLQTALRDIGKDVWLVQARDLDRPGLTLPRLDLLMTLGGDGTILRAARLAAPQSALVLGVNMGQLGFLAELGPADILAQVPAVVNGAGWVEERMMLRAVIRSSGRSNGLPSPPIDGVNDVIVARGARPRAMSIAVNVDGQHLQTYVADGVLVCSPTGSTAYALAMDGPIVHPEIKALQITPIAPHLTIIRSIVVPGSATVDLTIHIKEPAIASVDGQIDVPLADEASVQVTASPYVARFLRLQPRSYFYQTLFSRLSTSIVRGLL